MISYSFLEGGSVSYPLLHDRATQNFVTEIENHFICSFFQVSWEGLQFWASFVHLYKQWAGHLQLDGLGSFHFHVCQLEGLVAFQLGWLIFVHGLSFSSRLTWASSQGGRNFPRCNRVHVPRYNSFKLLPTLMFVDGFLAKPRKKPQTSNPRFKEWSKDSPRCCGGGCWKSHIVKGCSYRNGRNL